MKQMGFYIDSATCIGCKTCEIACKDHKNLPVGVRLRKARMPRSMPGGSHIQKQGKRDSSHRQGKMHRLPVLHRGLPL